MKKYIFLLITSFLVSKSTLADHEPSPLVDVKINVSVTTNKNKGTTTYSYKLSNPKTNSDGIGSFEVFLSRDREKDLDLPLDQFSQCQKFHKITSIAARVARPIVTVGSTGPKNWMCGYAPLAGYTDGSFGWAADDFPVAISPGKELGGFSLVSKSLPAIRTVLVEPVVNYETLPAEYAENIEKTDALTNRIKWVGKTIGPAATRRMFVASEFIDALISMKNEAFKLDWVKGETVKKIISAELDLVKKKIELNQPIAAKVILNALVLELDALQCKKSILNEAHVLLSMNAKYLADSLPKK